MCNGIHSSCRMFQPGPEPRVGHHSGSVRVPFGPGRVLHPSDQVIHVRAPDPVPHPRLQVQIPPGEGPVFFPPPSPTQWKKRLEVGFDFQTRIRQPSVFVLSLWSVRDERTPIIPTAYQRPWPLIISRSHDRKLYVGRNCAWSIAFPTSPFKHHLSFITLNSAGARFSFWFRVNGSRSVFVRKRKKCKTSFPRRIRSWNIYQRVKADRCNLSGVFFCMVVILAQVKMLPFYRLSRFVIGWIWTGLSLHLSELRSGKSELRENKSPRVLKHDHELMCFVSNKLAS